MKTSLLIFLLSIQSALAAFPVIKASSISGDYADNKGSAYAESAYYELPKIKVEHKNMELKIDKLESTLVVRDPSTSVELDFDLGFLNVFKSFSFDQVNIDSNKELLNVSVEKIDLRIKEKNYAMTNISFFSDLKGVPAQDTQDISIIEGIILNAGIKIEKLEFENLDPEFFVQLQKENSFLAPEVNLLKKILEKVNKLKVPMIARNIDLLVKSGYFNGKAKIDSYINLWLRLGGEISTNEDKTALIIQLKKAKLGVFSIRTTLLNRLRSLELEGVSISGKTITIQL